jgi:16S rRNA (guanine527-N7)-methyltransferase
LTDEHLRLFDIFISELIEWNNRINLTGLTERKRILNELFLDSLIPAPHIPEKGRMLDVGSGAGFPAIVIKIYHPRLKIRLLEAKSKKVNFLKQVIRLLKLQDVEASKGRIERDFSNLYEEGFQLITARAVAGPDQIISWCSSLLSPEGFLICFLGVNSSETLKKIIPLGKKNALEIDRIIPYTLPGKCSMRKIAIFKKDFVRNP